MKQKEGGEGNTVRKAGRNHVMNEARRCRLSYGYKTFINFSKKLFKNLNVKNFSYSSVRTLDTLNIVTYCKYFFLTLILGVLFLFTEVLKFDIVKFIAFYPCN